MDSIVLSTTYCTVLKPELGSKSASFFDIIYGWSLGQVALLLLGGGWCEEQLRHAVDKRAVLGLGLRHLPGGAIHGSGPHGVSHGGRARPRRRPVVQRHRPVLHVHELVDEADGARDLRVAADVVKELPGLVELPLGDDAGRLEHVGAAGADGVARLVAEERAARPAGVGDGVAGLVGVQAEGAAEVGADVTEVGGGKCSDKGALNSTLI